MLDGRSAADELTSMTQENGIRLMGFVVIYDANVLYPSTLRDVLLPRCPDRARFKPSGPTNILDEVFDNLKATD